MAYFTIIQLPPLLLKKTSQGENNYLVQLKVVDSRRIGSHQARSKSLRRCWPSDKCMDVLQRGARTYNSALKPQSFCWWNKRSSSARKKRKRKKKRSNAPQSHVACFQKDAIAHVCIDTFCWVVTQMCVCTCTHSPTLPKLQNSISARLNSWWGRNSCLKDSHISSNSEGPTETFGSADCLWFVFWTLLMTRATTWELPPHSSTRLLLKLVQKTKPLLNIYSHHLPTQLHLTPTVAANHEFPVVLTEWGNFRVNIVQTLINL